MNPQDTEAIAVLWLEAFNNHNLEQLLSLYHEEALHYSPKLKIKHPKTEGYIQGKAALREWWAVAFKTLPSLQYKIIKFTANVDRVFMEYIRCVDNEPDMKIAEVLEVQNNTIIASRVYHG